MFLGCSRPLSELPVAFIVQNVYTVLLFNIVVCSTYKYGVFLHLLHFWEDDQLKWRNGSWEVFNKLKVPWHTEKYLENLMSLQPLEYDDAFFFFCLAIIFCNDWIQVILAVTLPLDFYGVVSF